MRNGSGYRMGEVFREWRSKQVKYVSVTGETHKAEKPFRKLNKLTRKMLRTNLKQALHDHSLKNLKGMSSVYSKKTSSKNRWERRNSKK